jgi:predicted CopG family antitoxin
MSIRIETAQKLLGKPLKDSYGRMVGHVVGYINNIKNEVVSIAVELGSGEFQQFPSSQFALEGETITLHPRWMSDYDTLVRDLNLAQRRNAALEELFKNEEVPKTVYEDLHKSYSEVLTQLSERKRTLLSELKERSEEIDRQVKELHSFFANLKVAHMTGEVDDMAFRTASDALKTGIDRLMAEKRGIDTALTNISKPETASMPLKPTEIPKAPPKPAEPKEGTLVVHVEDKD